MDFSLSDHQKLIRDTVRQFMDAEVRPTVKQRDREERFPAAEIKKLADLGCCGMMTPEEWGGPGLDTLSYVLMLEEVARVDAGMATSLGVTNSAVQIPLLKYGTQAQKEKYLRRLATGEILGAFLPYGTGRWLRRRRNSSPRASPCNKSAPAWEQGRPRRPASHPQQPQPGAEHLSALRAAISIA